MKYLTHTSLPIFFFFNQDIHKRRPFSVQVCQSWLSTSNNNIYISEWFHGNNSLIVEILNETTCHILGIGDNKESDIIGRLYFLLPKPG